MRLKQQQIDFIKSSAKLCFNDDIKIYLFGSRVDDTKKGGDIDLYIETEIKEEIIQRKIKYLVALKKELGDQKIDVVINNFTTNLPIYEVAKTEGIQL